MRRRLPLLILLAALLGFAIFWVVTAPRTVDADKFAGLTPDLARGEWVYTAAGCASCHAGTTGEAEALEGGMAFASGFGTFYAPNISPSAAGIGGWSLTDFASALQRGTSPEGQHYYPAFPFGAYAKMTPQDVASLYAYMMTLPPSDAPSAAHDVGFPFNIRRTLGGWKFLFFRDTYVMETGGDPQLEQGRYLVEALAHCGECHTPRNALGGLDTARWLAGAPDPSGKGTIPNITPAKLAWSPAEVAYYLETGFTPEFDSVGGHMAHVVTNFSKLTAEDRDAVAAYLSQVPPAE